MPISIEINRLNIAMHGVSAQLIEEAIVGLDTELSLRLQRLNIGKHLSSQNGGVNISELSMAPIQLGAVLDAGSLRSVIADRLLDAINMQDKTVSQGEF